MMASHCSPACYDINCEKPGDRVTLMDVYLCPQSVMMMLPCPSTPLLLCVCVRVWMFAAGELIAC